MQTDWRFHVAKNFLLRLSLADETPPQTRKQAGFVYKYLEKYFAEVDLILES